MIFSGVVNRFNSVSNKGRVTKAFDGCAEKN